ncbi:hypothetical protein POPTR_001G443700v4 [Populus trichocarpa]|uniref:Uncharacterized protein n=1 Tax=Populus trichocarpa TaxID=3694 RepID=A0ACC0TPM0_POPTR|nr:hypothetical protein POPTR_001G443700v4 [Populus trichocarpa]
MAIESVGGSILSKIAELLVEPTIRQFRYMFCFNNFVQEFNEQKKNLALTLDRLQNAVEVAERNAEEIEKDVNKWLEDAKNEIEGVNRLENEKGKNSKCFNWCPNWIPQFKKFPKVSHKAPLQDIEFLPSKGFTPSESSKEAFEQIMKALKDDSANMIGLYGMGGVGKTTLVKEVGRKAKELQLFNEVLIATVSQNPNVTDMQDQMADSLGLHFDEKSKEGRAGRLWQRLQGKKMLIILDDVWKDIDLKEIGIPFGDAHRCCKIVITTRLENICSYMECQQKVFLRVLSEEEAWALFKINAGLRDEDSDLNRVAKEVARECQGFLEHEWEVASEELKKSQSRHVETFDDRRNAYACLKLSYDYLKHEETKLCFLLCCLFSEDYNIPIEELTRYAVGYGLYQDVKFIEGARKRVYMEIENLKACCMLLGTETEEYVQMHDLVRDVAIQIASSEKYRFMVKAGFGLKEWPMSNRRFEGCTVISLMGNKLAELPQGLVCPQLKVLLLELDGGLNVPERFFEGMKEIEVLSLKGGCLSLQSLEFSTNLQSLLLVECICKDLVSLRNLQRLKILVFMWCDSIKELPDEMGELKELRLLDVTGCMYVASIPVNLIGRLKMLEELLIWDGSFTGWDSTGGMNARVTELNSLSHLAVLSLTIPKVECIPRDFVFPRLLKYDIVLGNGYSITAYPISTRLYLGDISATSLNAKTFEQLFPTVSQIGFSNVERLENIDFLQRLEHVEVAACGDIRTLFPAKWRQALKNLRSVEINHCNSLEEIFELGEADEGSSEEKELPLLSSLTELQLSWLPELKWIWKGPSRHFSLQSLNHLELWYLSKLTFIFTPSLAQSLIHLETLRIEYCRGLKHLIREKDDEREIIPESLRFPKLKTLSIIQLKVLDISTCEELEQIIAKDNDDENLQILSRSDLQSSCFPNLCRLEIERCNKLKSLFPVAMASGLPKLQILKVSQCSQLLGVFGQDDHASPFNAEKEMVLPDMLELLLENLPSIVCFSPGCYDFLFPRLKTLKVYECPKLTTKFSTTTNGSMSVQSEVLLIGLDFLPLF